ncbi:MAG: hypothetical protein GTO24_21205 [candidate division Zixibacteria bacterium]|nr:hypothetical protein [candidate division Zixibacteria bacterium]
MRENYEDIKSRIKEAPSWYDANGTPRYGDFRPDRCPNIYSSQVGLFLISCQRCNEQFRVEMHADLWGRDFSRPPSKWHYGDPPIHECVGDTMNSIPLAVLEFWTRELLEGWTRREEFEGVIDKSQKD